MALGTGTMNDSTGGRPSAPTYLIDLSFTLDSSYPTGGTAGFAALVQTAARAASPALNVTITKDDIFGIKALDAGGYSLAYDKANDKLKCYWCAGSGAAMTEVTNATDLHTVTARVVVECR